MTFYVSIALQGGLGNQLFQIFTAAAEAIRSGRHLVCTHIDPNRPSYNGQFFTVPREPTHVRFHDVKEQQEYKVQPFPSGNIRLKGYFQTKDYFDALFDACTKAVQFKMPRVETRSGTVLHVRRSDYKKYPNVYDVLDESYYKFQIQECPRPYTLVTDDLHDPFTKTLAHDLQATLESGSSDFFTLFAHNTMILANSTFSWWAAYLARKMRPTETFCVKVPPYTLSRKHGMPFLPL